MPLFSKIQTVGLDIGQSAVKAVALTRRGNRVDCDGMQVLDCRAEGILDDTEVRTELKAWLKKKGWGNHEVTVGVPQFLASTETTEFPPGSDRNLDEMVAFETQNLAGLSEEAFIFDYQRFPPRAQGENAVLIGICRESVIRERADGLTEAGIQLADFAIAGTALAAAYFDLYPKALANTAPQLIVDIGAESSTAVIVAGKEVLYTCALMFGTDRYLKSLAQALDVTPKQAEPVAWGADLGATDQATCAAAAAPLHLELQTAIENWRSQERPEVGRLQFTQVALCGGGAGIAGMEALLASWFGCPAEIIGVPTPGEAHSPRHMIAYGLALQGIDKSRLHVSLAPRQVRWMAKRRRRFPQLATAALFLIALVAMVEFRTFVARSAQRTDLEDKQRNIDRCNLIVPGLESTDQSIGFHQKMLLPFVEKGNHAQRTLTAMEDLGAARQKMLAAGAANGRKPIAGWGIYLADEESFHAGAPRTDDDATDSTPPPGLILLPGTNKLETADATTMIRIPVEDLEPWDALVAGVYTTLEPTEPYRLIRLFLEALEDRTMFAGVDLMPPDSAGREDVFLPWFKLSEANFSRHYRRFVLRLPFKETVVSMPPKSPSK